MSDLKIKSNKVVAFCGLYCSNCSKFINNKCPGCRLNIKATWCKIKACCIEKEISTCAECSDFNHVKQCPKYNNVFAKLIEFVARTDRSRGIEIIKLVGLESFIMEMEKVGKMSLPKEKK